MQPKRSIAIDFLRGVAVLSVLFSHYSITAFTSKTGWIGVDLFFVLSGFLVSGLLFTEYKKNGTINTPRFLIRRGFKIYPLFFIFIFSTFLLRWIYNESFNIRYSLGELLFIRNYTGGYWAHTWSLSVEEQFYFLLAGLAYMAVQLKWLNKKKQVNYFFIGFFIFCFAGRIINLLLEQRLGSGGFFNNWARYVHTHSRIDSLLFGVFISYHYHLNSHKFNAVVTKYKQAILPVAFICILPGLLFNWREDIMSSAGLSVLYLGFGMLLIYFVTEKTIDQKLESIFTKYGVRAISYAGMYSYSIYLWHVMVREYVVIKLGNKLNLYHNVEIIVYLALSIAIGVFLSIHVEYYFLKIRDRYYPSTGTTPQSARKSAGGISLSMHKWYKKLAFK